MKRALTRLLCCPDCRGDLVLQDETPGLPEVESGALVCGACLHFYAIVRGVPRFVGSDQYVASFSYEWNRWDQVQLDTANGRRESEETFAEKTGFTPEDVCGKLVLDVGCGAGRFLDVASRWGAHVIGIDLSYAVEAAHANVGARANVSVVQADVNRLPFRDGAFDAIFSLGVLHHANDTRRAFLRLPRLLKDGGDLAVWLYYYQDRVHNAATDVWRAVLRPFPNAVTYAWSWLLVTLLSWLWLRPVMSRAPWSNLRRLLPISMHPERQWRILDTFDWYSPRFQDKACSPRRVLEWCREGGIRDVEVLATPTAIRGRRDASLTRRLVRWPVPDIWTKRVVVFGAGAAGQQCAALLRRIGPRVLTAIVDNDPAKQRAIVEGVRVQRLEDLPRSAYDLVIVASMPGFEAISAQLRAAGLAEGVDFLSKRQLDEWYGTVLEYGLEHDYGVPAGAETRAA